MTRRELREHLMKELFLREFHPGDEFEEQCGLYREELEEASEPEKQELTEKAERIAALIPELDAAIDSVSQGWKTRRMGKVDLSILRLAYFEMREDDEVPVKVAINEAVELAKIYGGEDSPAFVNAILGKLARAMSAGDGEEA